MTDDYLGPINNTGDEETKSDSTANVGTEPLVSPVLSGSAETAETTESTWGSPTYAAPEIKEEPSFFEKKEETVSTTVSTTPPSSIGPQPPIPPAPSAPAFGATQSTTPLNSPQPQAPIPPQQAAPQAPVPPVQQPMPQQNVVPPVQQGAPFPQNQQAPPMGNPNQPYNTVQPNGPVQQGHMPVGQRMPYQNMGMDPRILEDIKRRNEQSFGKGVASIVCAVIAIFIFGLPLGIASLVLGITGYNGLPKGQYPNGAPMAESRSKIICIVGIIAGAIIIGIMFLSVIAVFSYL